MPSFLIAVAFAFGPLLLLAPYGYVLRRRQRALDAHLDELIAEHMARLDDKLRDLAERFGALTPAFTQAAEQLCSLGEAFQQQPPSWPYADWRGRPHQHRRPR